MTATERTLVERARHIEKLKKKRDALQSEVVLVEAEIVKAEDDLRDMLPPPPQP